MLDKTLVRFLRFFFLPVPIFFLLTIPIYLFAIYKVTTTYSGDDDLTTTLARKQSQLWRTIVLCLLRFFARLRLLPRHMGCFPSIFQVPCAPSIVLPRFTTHLFCLLSGVFPSGTSHCHFASASSDSRYLIFLFVAHFRRSSASSAKSSAFLPLAASSISSFRANIPASCLVSRILVCMPSWNISPFVYNTTMS